MRPKTIVFVLAITASRFVQPAVAADPETVTNGRQIEQQELVDLGSGVARVDLYRDNFYQYESQVQQLTETATAMEGGTVDVLLTVRRVTPCEVLVEPTDAGRTRMILKHVVPPFFGNLGTVWYCAQPSADYWNMLAKPIGLRIGDEIALETAKELRRRDVLRVTGRVESMPICMTGVFQPRVAAVVVDWKVVEVIVDPSLKAVRY
ncbi:MAG: hypothetical protein H6822_13030 [Planctomycetaceae bacterium]|nr:hypothetical protein [Planctomycetales bacterium]MCB9923101.1 hypothetical protein [Planctomycetaceae bacterium]